MRTVERHRSVAAGLAAGAIVLALGLASRCGAGPAVGPAPRPAPKDDRAFLLSLQRDAFGLGWFESSATTGLTLDRAGNLAPQRFEVASVAATGFMLATLPVGVERGYISREQGQARALRTLRTLLRDVPQEHGFLRHFVNVDTAANMWSSEFSTIDTTLAIAGTIVAGQYFGGEVRQLADELYARAEWTAALTEDGQLIHGWSNADKPLANTWDSYSEGILCYVLALGSPTHPIPEPSWLAWDRVRATYGGRETFLGGLFEFTYPAAFISFRNRPDVRSGGLDYHKLFHSAVWVNRQFCIDEGRRGGAYGEMWWSLSATDGPDGRYHAYQPLPPNHDGTINIPVLLSAVSLSPELVLPAARDLYQTCGSSYGRYGFSGANNKQNNWTSGQVITIDTACAVLGVENHLSGLVWDLFHRSEAIRRAFQRAGMRADR